MTGTRSVKKSKTKIDHRTRSTRRAMVKKVKPEVEMRGCGAAEAKDDEVNDRATDVAEVAGHEEVLRLIRY